MYIHVDKKYFLKKKADIFCYILVFTYAFNQQKYHKIISLGLNSTKKIYFNQILFISLVYCTSMMC